MRRSPRPSTTEAPAEAEAAPGPAPAKRATKAKPAADPRNLPHLAKATRHAPPAEAPVKRTRAKAKAPDEAHSANGERRAAGRDASRPSPKRATKAAAEGCRRRPGDGRPTRPPPSDPSRPAPASPAGPPAPSGSSSGSSARRAGHGARRDRPRRVVAPTCAGTPTCWSTAGRRRALEHALGAAVPDDLAATLAAGPDAFGSTTAEQPPAPRPTRTQARRPTRTLKEGLMARSRSGTRGRRGPRKPPCRHRFRAGRGAGHRPE